MAAGDELLGRAGPLGRLREIVARADAGSRSVAFVTGPAGIGKSSLVRTALAGVEVQGWGTCVESEAAPGYWPWSRALDGVAAAIGRDATASTAGDDAGMLARIGRSFGPAVPSEGSERDRFALMDAVSRWLVRVAADHGPVVITLDDLQWADESSLALLEFTVRDPAPAAVAVIGCYRADELTAPARRRLSALSMSAVGIELEGLDRTAVEVLATAIAGPLDADSIDDLFRRTGGHPVFTRELALLERDTDSGHRVPIAVRDAIEQRLARFPAATAEVLEIAALAGNATAIGVVAVAAMRPRTEVDDALLPATSAGVAAVDGDHVRLAHDLYRETIVAGIAADRRVALHQRLGAALADRAERGDAIHPADIARHFAAAMPAGETSRAARWALAAAHADVASLAFAEAAAHLKRWRDALAVSPANVSPREHATVLLAEADALARAGAIDDARSRLRSAQAITSAATLVDVAALVALAFADLGARFAVRRDEIVRALEDALTGVEGVDVDLEARVTARLARELQHSVAADRPRAGPLSERAILLGRASTQESTLVTSLLARHDVLWIPGQPAERIEVAREIVELAERSGDAERLAEGQLLLANALLESGSAAFETALDECLRLLDQLGQPRHRYTAATRRAAVLLLRGELDAADEAIEDATDLGASIREPDADNVRMSQRLELVRARGAPHELREFAEAATQHWTGAPIHAHAVAAGFCARAGDLPAARRHLAVVVDLGSWREDRSYLWSVGVRELATAAIAVDDRPLCEELLQDVAPIASTCGVNGAVVAFAGSHGHVAGLLASHLGKLGGAELLADASATYERLGAHAHLRDLVAASSSSTSGDTGTVRPFAALTARESEVLVLVARGLSNDEIVAALVVSPATVRNHITRIFQKLQVRTRAQAIVLAREAGLT